MRWQYSQGPGEETVRAMARRCGSTHRDLGRRQSVQWQGDVAVFTGTWGGDSQGSGQEMWQYSQEPGVETVRAMARRCGSTHRDLGRRQSVQWQGDVAVFTGTWGGDSQGSGQEMWQYSQEPGVETVRAMARRCGSTHRNLGTVRAMARRCGSTHRNLGTVRAMARRCGSTHRDLGRRQSGHWPGEEAVCTGTWGGDSQTGRA